MSNTRFNPSLSGPLHIGHVYMALVNHHYAKATNGMFYVRLDDMHLPSLDTIGFERMTRMADVMTEQLMWMGLDGIYERESSLLPHVRERVHESCTFLVPTEPHHYADYHPTPLWIGGHSLVYPYSPTLTMHKVIMDHEEGVDVLIRGDELMSEVSLYSYYCELMGWKAPRFIYLPRLRCSEGEISKSLGGNTLAEYQAWGYRPYDIIMMLASACLKNPANGWGIENIKDRPCL